ncbi:N-myc-interactor isoform X1 [Sorex araneus]|uniref:N-myc-interactor isoform X1 n=1 Tax=Sorex araneus TaxID=42254 RepID=UPI0024338E13|nr:N-myc-interactor isoform X1 [Sorex araneus]XP_055000306.1 N-myc-interactor isoform X1 [Sorex araneus]
MADDDNDKKPVLQEQKPDEEPMKDEQYKELIDEITKENIQLKEEIQKLESELQEAARNSQIKEDIPDFKLKFTTVENPENTRRFLNVSCSFQVNSQISYELQKGQALITFENEEVAQNVISIGKHQVMIDGVAVEMMAGPVPLSSGVRFQFHVEISKMKIKITGIPDVLPENIMRDKLELTFYKSRSGGGEVDHVEYDKESGSAVITFVESGAVDRILKKKDHLLYLNKDCHQVTVSPYVETYLKKFQVFSGLSKRTVLLTGMEAIPTNDEESVEDSVNIHFQRKKNGGGEVEVVKCCLNQPYMAYFEEQTQGII